VNNGQTGSRYHFEYESGYTYDTLIQPIEAIVYKGGNSWDGFGHEEINSRHCLMKYTTTDNFQNVSDGEALHCSQFSSSQNGIGSIAVTSNPKINSSVIVAATVNLDLNTEQTGLFIYEYNPWE